MITQLRSPKGGGNWGEGGGGGILIPFPNTTVSPDPIFSA